MDTLHFYVQGRVQGVGYRAWCIRQAKLFGLSGWVRNRMDGSVEIQALGEKETLKLFINACKKGPIWANVKMIVPVLIPNAPIPVIEQGVFVQKPTV